MLASFLVAGLLALRSSAFLVIPQTHDLTAADALDASRLDLNLKCPQCPYPKHGDIKHMKYGVDSTMSLQFTTDHDRLLVNGQQVFPPNPKDFEVPTVVLSRKKDDKASPALPFGFVFELAPVEKVKPEAGNELLSFYFTVTDVVGYPVPVDTAHLHAVKAADGTLFIVKDKVEMVPTRKFCWKKCHGRPACLKALLFARIRSIFAAARARANAYLHKLKFKGCPGKLHVGPGHRPGPFSPRPHPHHHKHHGISGVIHRIVNVLLTFGIPALLGLTAGITVCVLGMVIGHAAVALWLRFRRRQCRHSPADQETGEAEEKEGLMEEEDLPPRYEDEDENAILLPAEKE